MPPTAHRSGRNRRGEVAPFGSIVGCRSDAIQLPMPTPATRQLLKDTTYVWLPVGRNVPGVGDTPPSREPCNEPFRSQEPLVHHLAGLSRQSERCCRRIRMRAGGIEQRERCKMLGRVLGAGGAEGGPVEPGGVGSVGSRRSLEHPALATRPTQNAVSRRCRDMVNSCWKRSRYQETREAGGNLLMSTRRRDAPVEAALYCGQHIVNLVIPLRVDEGP